MAIFIQSSANLKVRLEIDDRPRIRFNVNERQINNAFNKYTTLELDCDWSLTPAPAGPRSLGSSSQQRVREGTRHCLRCSADLFLRRAKQSPLQIGN